MQFQRHLDIVVDHVQVATNTGFGALGHLVGDRCDDGAVVVEDLLPVEVFDF
jgi:hypothetical protein